MKKEYSPIIIVIIYMLIMLTVCFFTVKALKEDISVKHPVDESKNNDNIESTAIYIPVYIGSTPSETKEEKNTDSESSLHVYFIREYNEKIGIFSDEGKLIRILDVYVKTLPKADREMLEEGIEVNGIGDLNKIIEDYTG